MEILSAGFINAKLCDLFMVKYYLDTSIWLDLFEDRDEQGLPKGEYAERLLEKIISEDGKIILSDIVTEELIKYGYTAHQLFDLFMPFEKVVIYEKSDNKRSGRARDLAQKRNLPRLDALHALVAKDAKALIISRDAHFKQLKDIAKCKRPEELI